MILENFSSQINFLPKFSQSRWKEHSSRCENFESGNAKSSRVVMDQLRKKRWKTEGIEEVRREGRKKGREERKRTLDVVDRRHASVIELLPANYKNR